MSRRPNRLKLCWCSRLLFFLTATRSYILPASSSHLGPSDSANAITTRVRTPRLRLIPAASAAAWPSAFDRTTSSDPARSMRYCAH